MPVNVQFTLSKDEYEQLKALADKKGISVPKYIKDCVLLKQEMKFEDIWDEFEKKLERFPGGIEFTISSIMTENRWRTLSRSTKLSLAKLFNKKVKNEPGSFHNVYLKDKSSSNVSIYEKKKQEKI